MEFSPHVDALFLVEDSRWGGFLPGTEILSPTSQVIVDVSDTLIAIGGGGVALAEFRSAQTRGIPTRFIPAEKRPF